MRGTAAFRADRDKIERRVRLALQRAADRVVERLLILDVGPIEADHHQGPFTNRRARRLLRRGARQRLALRKGAVDQAGPVQLAVLHRERHRRQIAALIADIGRLTRNVLAQLVQQPVDQYDGAVDLILQHAKLAMVLVDGAAQRIGRAHAVEQPSREARIAGGVVRQLVHAAQAFGNSFQLLLRFIPLLDQYRVARGRTDLELGVHCGDDFVIAPRGTDVLRRDLRHSLVQIADRTLQLAQIGAHLGDLAPDKGPGRLAGRRGGRGRLLLPRSGECRLLGRGNVDPRRRRCRCRRAGGLRRSRGIVPGQGGPQRVFDRAASGEQRGAEQNGGIFAKFHSNTLPRKPCNSTI